jgi:hypothetical protein
MPIVINDFEIVVPSAESTPPTPTTPAEGQGAAAWSAELARKLDEQLTLGLERAQRLQAD